MFEIVEKVKILKYPLPPSLLFKKNENSYIQYNNAI
jgi:hypothetical protein